MYTGGEKINRNMTRTIIHVSMESAMFNDRHGSPTAFLTNGISHEFHKNGNENLAKHQSPAVHTLLTYMYVIAKACLAYVDSRPFA